MESGGITSWTAGDVDVGMVSDGKKTSFGPIGLPCGRPKRPNSLLFLMQLFFVVELLLGVLTAGSL